MNDGAGLFWFVLVAAVLLTILCAGNPDLLDAVVEWVRVKAVCACG